MKKHTYVACDWNGNPVELSVFAENKAQAGEMARGILDGAREYIDIDEGVWLKEEGSVCE